MSSIEKTLYEDMDFFSQVHCINLSFIKNLNKISCRISRDLLFKLQKKWAIEKSDTLDILNYEARLFIRNILTAEQEIVYSQYIGQIENFPFYSLMNIACDYIRTFNKIILQILCTPDQKLIIEHSQVNIENLDEISLISHNCISKLLLIINNFVK